ncbi:acyclic terpene utilization AtuA family protein [Sphingoaurantiacus capsulatus]|uniref:Acyclic terpene utilization AtuA family protein n=1 Tax=Sphingoaurantiacus capsulatus TaxID=1771310 RepID=A0ABV7X5S7_9SPHN
MRSIRIGGGSAWWGDRIEPAGDLARRGDLDYLCFETMAEVTMSAAQMRKRREPDFSGFDSYLGERLEAVLPACLKRGTRIVSNQGWINPEGAAELAVAHLRRLGAAGVKVAAVSGAVITDRVMDLAQTVMETGRPVAELRETMVSAEVYLGVAGILEALAGGAQIVITGRVADPSLFAAPLIHEFGWSLDDWDKLGQAHGLGHLLECGMHVTGGYFPDPGFKDVPEPWNLGYPIAEVSADGSAVLSKLDGTGGAIDLRTVKEQMLYEVFDPAAYLTPDVVVDFSTVELTQVGPDRVRVAGISGKLRPQTLKVSIGCAEGFIGEDIFFFAGAGALERAQLGRKILEERYRMAGLQADELRIDLLGIDALHGAATPSNTPVPYELALRVAARTKTRAEATKVGREVDSMAVGGVGMTGKRMPFGERVREVIGIHSSLVARDAVPHKVTWFEA